MSDQPAAAITGYRWFRVGPDGLLRGARNVVWPADRDLHAEHVSMPLPAEPRPAHSALSRTGWTALRCAVMTAAAGMSLLMVAVAAWLLLMLTLNLSPSPPAEMRSR